MLRLVGTLQHELGSALLQPHRLDEARSWLEASLQVGKLGGNDDSVAVAFGELGTAAFLQGNLRQAAYRITQARELFDILGDPSSVRRCLESTWCCIWCSGLF